jgi:hypothetical protein
MADEVRSAHSGRMKSSIYYNAGFFETRTSNARDSVDEMVPSHAPVRRINFSNYFQKLPLRAAIFAAKSGAPAPRVAGPQVSVGRFDHLAVFYHVESRAVFGLTRRASGQARQQFQITLTCLVSERHSEPITVQAAELAMDSAAISGT